MEIIALLIIVFVAIGIQGKLFEKYVFRRLEYDCKFSVSEAHEGDELFLVETLTNNKILPVPWLKVEIYSSRWLHFADTLSVVTQGTRYVTSNFVLKGKQRIIRRWKLKCLKRGVFETENVTLVGGDLFGYGNQSIPVKVDAKIIVYPQIIDLEQMFVPVSYLQGDTIVKRWIIDDPFLVSGAREYTPRDSMNKIDWRATARAGNLMVKKYDFTSLLSYSIILNTQSIDNEYQETVNKDIVELGIKVAATILDRTLKNGMPVRLAVNGCTAFERNNVIFTEEASGLEHVRELLKILAALELKSIRDFVLFLENIMFKMQNTNIIIITAFVNEKIYHAIRTLKSRGNKVTVIVVDLVEARNIPCDIDVFSLYEDYKTEIENRTMAAAPNNNYC